MYLLIKHHLMQLYNASIDKTSFNAINVSIDKL